MANFWSTLFGRKEERLSIDEWASFYDPNGIQYPFRINGGSLQGKREEIGNDYMGYVQGAFKSNSVVFACCTTRMGVFTEARFQFQPIKDGRPQQVLKDSPELDILKTPWPNATTGDLLARALQDADFAGNHYVVREGKRLRRLRPDWVTIVLSADPTVAVASDVVGYVYKPGNTEDREKWGIYPIDGSNGKVAHWAPIPDPEAQYRGMSWITPVLREITSDKAAMLHKQKFFENGATPSMAVSFKETVTEEQFKGFVRALDEAHVGVENAYSPLYLGGGADVTPLTHDFAQLDFKKTQGAGETRIAAAAGVHPVVVGLSEGMQGSSLNAGNFKSAIDAFGNIRMRPLWRTIASAYAVLLNEPAGTRLWIDDRDIMFLQDDEMTRVKIYNEKTSAMTKLIQDGYTPESIVESMDKQDVTLLKHTGLFSVQLQPPLPQGAAAAGVDSKGNPLKQNPNLPPNKKAGRPATGPGTGTPKGASPGVKPTPLQNQAAAAANKAAAPKKPTP